MRAILKYPLPDPFQVAPLHLGRTGVILHAGLDPAGAPCLWAEVDQEPAVLGKSHDVAIVGTGAENVIPSPEVRWSHVVAGRAVDYRVPGPGWSHVSTFTDTFRHQFVWHVYAHAVT